MRITAAPTLILVVFDAFLQWPNVCWTALPTREFTQNALCKIFSIEGVPRAFAAENSAHFSAKSLNDWLQGPDCFHEYTATRQLQSNGLVENFVRTLKRAIHSISPYSFFKFNHPTDKFLLNANRCTTGKSLAQLVKSQCLCSRLPCDSSADVSIIRGNNFRPSSELVLVRIGNRTVTVLDCLLVE